MLKYFKTLSADGQLMKLNAEFNENTDGNMNYLIIKQIHGCQQ